MTLKHGGEFYFEIGASGSGFLYLIAVITSTKYHVFGNTSQGLPPL